MLVAHFKTFCTRAGKCNQRRKKKYLLVFSVSLLLGKRASHSGSVSPNYLPHPSKHLDSIDYINQLVDAHSISLLYQQRSALFYPLFSVFHICCSANGNLVTIRICILTSSILIYYLSLHGNLLCSWMCAFFDTMLVYMKQRPFTALRLNALWTVKTNLNVTANNFGLTEISCLPAPNDLAPSYSKIKKLIKD